VKKSLFISAFLSLMYGCASIEDSVSPAYVIEHKQSDAHNMREPVKRLISPATQSASYWNLSLSNDGDVAIQIPVNSRGHGEYETLSNGRRALIVKFTCDYEKGETTGRASVGFDGPSWHGLIKVRCIPMSSKEVAQQLDEEAKRQRIAAEEAAERERLEAQRLEKQKEQVRLLAAQKKANEEKQRATEKKEEESNPFYYGLLAVSRENLGVPNQKALEMARRSMPNCRNVLLAGPVGTTFDEAHMLAKANLSSNPKMLSSVTKQINDGIDCRKAWPSGWSCVGIAYVDPPTKAELFRPYTSGFEKHGAAYGDYVHVMARMKFRSGQSEVVSLFAQKKNVRCIGSERDAGMFSGMQWPYEPR